MAEPAENSWASQYRADFGTYDSCAAKLESLIRDLIEEATIDVVAIESRAKEPDSLERKVDEKRESYEAPLADVTDLIGVRIITYYLEDVERISEIIEQEFTVDKENSSDKANELEPDRFGYLSVHCVVSLSDPRAGLAEWSAFDGKKAEIQVRTATQHAWAAVEHKLNYRRTSEAPKDLRRKLMRLSALFELADEQFSAVKSELETVEARYTSDVKGGNLNLPIDTSSLEAFMDENTVVEGVVRQFEERGIGMEAYTEEGYREIYDRDLRDFATILGHLETETIAELDIMVREVADNPGNVAVLAEAFSDIFSEWSSPADLLTLLVGIHKGVPTEAFAPIFRKSVTEAIRKLRGEPQLQAQAEGTDSSDG